jgi:hypothetical protein
MSTGRDSFDYFSKRPYRKVGFSIWEYILGGLIFFIGIALGQALLTIIFLIVVFIITYFIKQRGRTIFVRIFAIFISIFIVFLVLIILAFLPGFIFGISGDTVRTSNTSTTNCVDNNCPSGGVCCKGTCYQPVPSGYLLDKDTCKIYPVDSVKCGEGICTGECCLGKCYESCPPGYSRLNKDSCGCYEEGGSTWNGIYSNL